MGSYLKLRKHVDRAIFESLRRGRQRSAYSLLPRTRPHCLTIVLTDGSERFVLKNFLACRDLIGTKKCLNQFSLTAHYHSWKSLEPFAYWDLGAERRASQPTLQVDLKRLRGT
jgi:hypothetical protein